MSAPGWVPANVARAPRRLRGQGATGAAPFDAVPRRLATVANGPRFAAVASRGVPSEVVAGTVLGVSWITLWAVFVAGIVAPGLSLLP